MDISIVQLDSILLEQFLQLRLLRMGRPTNHRQLEPVDVYIVQLVSIYLIGRFQQLRLLHDLLRSNHLQVEPVDIYILQLDSILERFLQLRVLHVLLPSDSIQSEFLVCPEQLADG